MIFNGPVVPFRREDKPRYEIKAKAKDEAEIWLYDEVGNSWDGTTAKMFADDLKELGDIKTLNVYINSPGGSVFDGTAIYNTLRRHRARKIVHIDGIAASIASVVAMAGDEINIAENGLIMIHDPWGFAMGTADEFRKMADSLDKVRSAILDTYISRTGGEEKQISDWMTAETWFTAQEAVDAGFADSIVEPVEMAALSKFDLSVFNKAPEITPPEGEQNSETDGKHPAILHTNARVAKLRAEQG